MDGDEKIVIGSDGKEVSRKVPKFIAQKRWYEGAESNPEGSGAKAEKRAHSEYAVKRDPYANYDTQTYRGVVESFRAKRSREMTAQADARIVDEYSKVVATSSQRDLKDYAHYLNDIPQLEFDTISPSREGPSSAFETGSMHTSVNTASEPRSEAPKHAVNRDGKGHTTVFGSYYRAGRWGYKCCKSLVFDSTCSQT